MFLKIELLNSLLLSLPGTPVLYYCDEIEMGDNIYLGDRVLAIAPMHISTRQENRIRGSCQAIGTLAIGNRG